MRGFYYSSDSNKGNNLDFFDGEYNSVARNAGKANFKAYYYDETLALFERDDDFCANGGVFIYKNKWNKGALELLLEDLASGSKLQDLLVNSRGQFYLITRVNGITQIATDRCGSIPVYAFHQGPLVEVTNWFLPLARNNEISINEQALGEFVSMFATYDKTIGKEIEQIEAGTIFTIADSKVEKTKYYDVLDGIEFGRLTSLDDVINKCLSILRSTYSFLGQDDRVHADLTGGFDTRTNLAAILNTDLNFTCGAVDEGSNGRYADSVIARKIARNVGLPIEFFPWACSTLEQREKFRTLAYEVAGNCRWGSLTSQQYYSRTAYYSHIGKRSDILVSGLFGTEVMTQFGYSHYAKENSKFDIDGFIDEYFPYFDVLKGNVLTGDDYKKNVKQWLSNIIGKKKFKHDNDVLSLIEYRCFCSCEFVKYVGMVNSIVPFYSPFLEPEMIRLMMETSYSLKTHYKLQRRIISTLSPEVARFNTTHGFPADVITHKNFFRYARMLDKRNPYGKWTGITAAAKNVARDVIKKSPQLYDALTRHKKVRDIGNDDRYGILGELVNLPDIEQLQDVGTPKIAHGTHRLKQRLNSAAQLMNDVGLV